MLYRNLCNLLKLFLRNFRSSGVAWGIDQEHSGPVIDGSLNILCRHTEIVFFLCSYQICLTMTDLNLIDIAGKIRIRQDNIISGIHNRLHGNEDRLGRTNSHNNLILRINGPF